MAVNLSVNLVVSKRDGVTISPTQKQSVGINNIVMAEANGGITELLIENTDSGTLVKLEVAETPAQIIIAADLTGYTQNGLAVLTTKVWDGTVFTSTKSKLLNEFRFTRVFVVNDTDLSIVNGAKIMYKLWMDRNPIPVIVTENLNAS